MASEKLIAQLRRDEGEVLHVYQDHLGYWTIGVGVLIDKRKGGGITEDESAYLLDNRLRRIEAELDRRIPWWRLLNDARQGVLLNMAYQLGVNGLLGFANTLSLIKLGRYDEAALHMKDSRWAKQTPVRAQRMMEQMVSGEWR